MAEGSAVLAHLLVMDRAEDHELRRRGGGDPKIRDVERRTHGAALRAQLASSLTAGDAERAERDSTIEELRAIGVVVVLESASEFLLKLESLDRSSQHRTQPRRPQWRLLSVGETSQGGERATVWISDEYRSRFVRLFEDYLERESKAGNPRNRELIANIAEIRSAVHRDLWRSEGVPPQEGQHWWELWLLPGAAAVELVQRYAAARELDLGSRVLRLNERTVVWMRGSWDELEDLPFTSVPITEIRRPEFAETVEDLGREDRDELTEGLADRLRPVGRPDAPAVCLLDSGVRASHRLLQGSLDSGDVHTVVGTTADRQNHGTSMAGLSLLGPLDDLLLGNAEVRLRHRLESVKILPDAVEHDPRAYGLVTAQAVSLPEVAASRQRVFSMTVTAPPDLPEQPSLWSASLDALAVGTAVAASDEGIDVLGAPDPSAARLFVVSAGNVSPAAFKADYRAVCDVSPIEDPAHAWNALTVGAYTEMTSVPGHPDFAGWSALGGAGEISPHSRTSLTFENRTWPIKPEICMEGGNVLTDGATDFVGDHPVLTPRTIDARDDLAIGSAGATSAATAQAARLGALVQATYPSYWPETVRGLLVHSADWTPAMRAVLDEANSKTQRLQLLRRYGWGVPREDSVLGSSQRAVTTVSQDEFVPFEGEDYLSRRFRLHRLPWPAEVLRGIADGTVTLRITLSYFVEPTASRRGWRRRYAYASHGLRFELKAPTESVAEFLQRVNREGLDEEESGGRPSRTADRWLIGPNQRNLGSLHQDIWQGSGADLAQMGVVAVYPIGGWWKNAKRDDRRDRAVRYALLVSLTTDRQDVDLYSPIAAQLELPLAVEVPA